MTSRPEPRPPGRLQMATPAQSVAATRPPLPGESSAPKKEVFYPIDLDGLVVDTIVDFNLFLPAGHGRLLFFRGQDLEFTVRHRNRLLDNNVRTVFVRATEHDKYQRYLEHHLERVLSNADIPSRKKAKLLYSVSATVVRECLEQPRSNTILPRTRRLAASTVEFVLRDERSLGQLASLMRSDYYTFTHSINVSVFTTALAQKTGVTRREVEELATGALLHDIGKTQVPKELLARKGPLSLDEMQVVREHVLHGEHLLRELGTLSHEALIVVAQHHERLDGSGYPRGLTGNALHLFGRIAGIADSYDAMTSTRSYQPAMSPFAALTRMRTDLRPHFDQKYLADFIRLLRAPELRVA
jgi:putative nucleotidyltransferase with HDIG domain